MGWIFHCKKRWGLIQITGSNHESGTQRFTSFRPQTPQNQAAHPPQMVAAAPGTCLPAHGIPPESAAAPGSWGVSGTEEFLLCPMARETRAAGPAAETWDFSQTQRRDFEPKRDLPQRAVCSTPAGSLGLGRRDGGFLGFNELFLNFPVTTLSFRRQRHAG